MALMTKKTELSESSLYPKRKRQYFFYIHTRTPSQALTVAANGNKRYTMVKSVVFSSSTAQRFIFPAVASGSQTCYPIALRGCNQALRVNQKVQHWCSKILTAEPVRDF